MPGTKVQATEVGSEVVAASGLSRNAKVGIIVGASALTAGLAYGIYRLAKLIKSRRAAKAAVPSETVDEEAHE